MEKCKVSQGLKLTVIVALLIVAPFLSSPLRSTYLYFLFNLLIIALALESGLLSSSSSSHAVATLPPPKPPVITAADGVTGTGDETKRKSSSSVLGPAAASSIFFIGGDTTDGSDEDDDEMEEEEEAQEILSGQEDLFNRAENFIANFYKQLKMQRETVLEMNTLPDFF